MKCVICGMDIGCETLTLPFLVDEMNGAIHKKSVAVCADCGYELANLITRNTGLVYRMSEKRVCSE